MSSALFAMMAGVSVVMQNSLNGMMNPYVGSIGTAAVGFVIQLALLLGYHTLFVRDKLSLRRVPLICYSGGLLATFTVGLIGFCIARMGSAVTTCCSVAGQLMLSALVDHFGWFGSARNRFVLRRVPGFALILTGVLLINLLGGTGTGQTSLGLLLLALLLGCSAIVIRTMNYKASQAAGSTIGGGIVNSTGGTVSGILLYLLLSGFRPDLSGFAQAPAVCYAAGAFGTACLLFNIAAYRNQNIFYATIFMLIGQVVTGVVMDVCIFHALSAGKCIGIAVILTGVLADKLLTRTPRGT